MHLDGSSRRRIVCINLDIGGHVIRAFCVTPSILLIGTVLDDQLVNPVTRDIRQRNRRHRTVLDILHNSKLRLILFQDSKVSCIHSANIDCRRSLCLGNGRHDCSLTSLNRNCWSFSLRRHYTGESRITLIIIVTITLTRLIRRTRT